MGFRNSILAGEELVRSGIRSENYAAGIAGWRVGQDGTAEFLDVFVRGTVVVGQGTIDADGLHFPAEDISGGHGPPPTLENIGVSWRFVEVPTDVAAQITGGQWVTGSGPYVLQDGRLFLYGFKSIQLNADTAFGLMNLNGLEVQPALRSDAIFVGTDDVPVLELPHTEVANVAPAGTIVATGAPVNLPGTRLRVVGFTKLRDDTKLVVAFTGASSNSGGLNVFSVYADVDGADTVIAAVLGVAQTQAGARAITGIAAGTFDVEIQANVSAGTQTMTGRWSLTVTETY